MKKQRVVITGLGVVTPVGSTLDEFWSALVNARTGIGALESIPTNRLKTKIAAQVKAFDSTHHFDVKSAALLDRFSQFAIVAARMAIEDSGLELSDDQNLRVATIIGTGSGGQTTLDEAYQKFYAENVSKVHPLTIPKMMISAAASQVSMDLRLHGPTLSVSSACASGTHAVGYAFQLISMGQAQIALAGGTEASLIPGSIKAWEALPILTSDMCRPFSKDRSGLVLGEGAGVLVLEGRDHAINRGAKIYAEIAGFGMSADAADLMSPDIKGASFAMAEALRDAKLAPEEIAYINAHGTGTKINDRVETAAVRNVFRSHADKLMISSNKGVLGHGLGCAGALEAVSTALTMQTQIVPPTANYNEADPECDLDVVPNIARQTEVRAAISNSFAFGGLNAVLAFVRAV